MERKIALDLLILLCSAKLGEEIARRLGQPTVIGHLCMGIVVGAVAGVLGFSFDLNIQVFAKFGIWLLLFMAGLEVSLAQLIKIGKAAIVIACAGAAVPFAGGLLLGKAFGFSTISSLLIGTALMATSVGVSVEILRELGMIRTRLGALVVGTAVADDVVGIFALSVLSGFAGVGESGVTASVVKLAFGVVILFVGGLTLGIKAIKYVERTLDERRQAKVLPSGKVVFAKGKRVLTMAEAPLTIALIVMLAFAIIAESLGMAMITGAFVAGLMLGEARMHREIANRISTLGNALFVPIFFCVTGLNFDLGAFQTAGAFTVALVAVAVGTKALGCGAAARAFGFSGKSVGFAMIPRAEICLIVALLGLHGGLIAQDVFSSVLVTVIVTSLLGPPFIKRYFEQSKVAAEVIPEVRDTKASEV